MERIAKYETNDGHLFDTREEADEAHRREHRNANEPHFSRASQQEVERDWVPDNLKTFKELIDLNGTRALIKSCMR